MSIASRVRAALAAIGSGTANEIADKMDEPGCTGSGISGQLSVMRKAGRVTSSIGESGRVVYALAGGGHDDQP